MTGAAKAAAQASTRRFRRLAAWAQPVVASTFTWDQRFMNDPRGIAETGTASTLRTTNPPSLRARCKWACSHL